MSERVSLHIKDYSVQAENAVDNTDDQTALIICQCIIEHPTLALHTEFLQGSVTFEQRVNEQSFALFQKQRLREALALVFFSMSIKNIKGERNKQIMHNYEIYSTILENSPKNDNIWNELKSVYNTFRNIGGVEVAYNSKQLDVEYFENEKYWIDGLSQLYLSYFAKTILCREELVMESMKNLSFYSTICPNDQTYFSFITDFVKVIPNDEIEPFVASLLMNNIKLEFVIDLVEKEIMRSYYYKQERLQTLRHVLNVLNTPQTPMDLDDYINGLIFGKERCDVLKISILVNGRISDREDKIYCLSNLIQYISEMTAQDSKEEKIICDTLKLFAFEMIRPIISSLSNILTYPHSLSNIITAVINNTATGLESDERILVVFSIYASKIEHLLNHIGEQESRMVLCFALSEIYSRLAEVSQQSLYIEKRDFYGNACWNSISPDDEDDC
ncbi:predicted protein [Naegleria gruberi]|uniref:Predicted protein n=1 Tax=Naegleria gruberi TaxID=5762 RepID=D2V033_NAEGR|nr:uncharacterized protein NAEGRDRAFT_62153 [Naegleria gruberi]EFC49645.1 predicted protein [Naegleria gruberi]|eukprot:XP_002682389.1 predicted protein [Naegleria gruberi strain NEG-M]